MLLVYWRYRDTRILKFFVDRLLVSALLVDTFLFFNIGYWSTDRRWQHTEMVFTFLWFRHIKNLVIQTTFNSSLNTFFGAIPAASTMVVNMCLVQIIITTLPLVSLPPPPNVCEYYPYTYLLNSHLKLPKAQFELPKSAIWFSQIRKLAQSNARTGYCKKRHLAPEALCCLYLLFINRSTWSLQ